MNRTKSSFDDPISVLVVDDNILDRKILTMMLAKSSANLKEIETAGTLKKTIKILENSDIDVVVLDLNLPDSTGPETLTSLTSKFPSLAIVVNTGAYEDDLGLQTMSLGAQDFIIKGKFKSYGLTKSIHYAKERKRIELELYEAYNNLQDTQHQLIQAEKLNSIGRLASGVAHEVKNPLATILFGVAFLQEKIKPDDEKIKLTLNSITDSANRANNIIKDLLDFASISKLDKKDECLNEIIEKSLSLTRHALHKNTISVEKDLNENLPAVNIDRNKVEQVLVNLIINAVHAMPDGGKLILRTFDRDVVADDLDQIEATAGDRLVILEVEDSGEGIDQETLGKIFDPFFTTKRSSGGVGLGLSVARNIIEMHSGLLTIENGPEKGVIARMIFKTQG